MSDLGKLHKPQDDLNDVPISPSGPDIPMAKAKREAPDQVAKGGGDDASHGRERVVDTEKNPDARPPGDPKQDMGPSESKRNLESESGGPTPVIGP